MATEEMKNATQNSVWEVKLEGTIMGGLCWDNLTRERMQDPRALERFGYKVYSQNDEDGILQEIFRRIGVTNKVFVEFGTQDGLESIGHYLLLRGWSGVWIEGDESAVERLKERFRPAIAAQRLCVLRDFITRDNINSLIRSAGVQRQIDLLSVDVDGNDYHIWKAIEAVTPRVVVVEFNGKIPPDLDWKMAYDANHIWDGSDRHGASLKALELLGKEKGYTLVGTNLNGVNAFFVRADLVTDSFMGPYTAEYMYNPLRLDLKFVTNHPSRYFLGCQKAEYGLLDYIDVEPVLGFHNPEFWESETGKKKCAWTSAEKSVLRFLKKKEANTCVIPYFLPNDEQRREIYTGELEVSSTFACGKKLCAERKEDAIYIYNIGELPIGAVIVLSINRQKLWSPSEIAGSNDTRKLGIAIRYEEIKFL